MSASPPTSLERRLADVVGDEHLLTDPDLLRSYETDWTGRRLGPARAVVRPAATGQVSAVLVACASARVPVVVQGGNTGLVSGGVPAGGEVVLSTRRLRAVGPVDPVGRCVVVGAGATLEEVQHAARPHGLDVGVDLASRGSASIGGMVATNAGGSQVVRYGAMRAQVAGVEAVLADGGVLDRLGAMAKESTGYDLSGLLCGSEGTLAVITAVTLRLVSRPANRTVAIIGLPDVAAAVDALATLRSRLPMLLAAELMTASGVRLVREHSGWPPLTSGEPEAYLLVDTEDAPDVVQSALGALGSVADDAVLASDDALGARLRGYRERHTEAIAAWGGALKLDVAVPLAGLAGFVDDLPALVDVPGAEVVVFGHLAEGNLHVNVLGLGEASEAERVTDVVLRRVAALGGAISAEHGVGRAKAQWLSLTRSGADIAAMRAVKQALDPTGLLGPGVMLPAVL